MAFGKWKIVIEGEGRYSETGKVHEGEDVSKNADYIAERMLQKFVDAGHGTPDVEKYPQPGPSCRFTFEGGRELTRRGD